MTLREFLLQEAEPGKALSYMQITSVRFLEGSTTLHAADIGSREEDWGQLTGLDAIAYKPRWPLTSFERARLALAHEPEASSSPDGFRLATCVVCKRPMVAMWHLWLDDGGLKKEIHMCHACATDIYGAPIPDLAMDTGYQDMNADAGFWFNP